MLELASSYKGSLLREKRGLWKSDGDDYLIEGTFCPILKKGINQSKEHIYMKKSFIEVFAVLIYNMAP